MLKVLVKNYDSESDLTKSDPRSTLKTLCVKYFVNQKIVWLLKIKNNIVNEIDCSNYKIVYFREFKRSLTLYFIMSSNGQKHFKNLVAFAARF